MTTRKSRARPRYALSSGNVYADLRYAAGDDMLVKARLVTRIAQILRERELTQTEAARIVGLPQPKLSKLLRGQFRGFSERKLIDCLTRLGSDVRIVITDPVRRRSRGTLSVVFAADESH